MGAMRQSEEKKKKKKKKAKTTLGRESSDQLRVTGPVWPSTPKTHSRGKLFASRTTPEPIDNAVAQRHLVKNDPFRADIASAPPTIIASDPRTNTTTDNRVTCIRESSRGMMFRPNGRGGRARRAGSERTDDAGKSPSV
jgi:hypothetical protein